MDVSIKIFNKFLIQIFSSWLSWLKSYIKHKKIIMVGSGMNPARSLGPAIMVGSFANHWVYWVGPLLGGVIAGIIYQTVLKVNGHKASSVSYFLTLSHCYFDGSRGSSFPGHLFGKRPKGWEPRGLKTNWIFFLIYNYILLLTPEYHS